MTFSESAAFYVRNNAYQTIGFWNFTRHIKEMDSKAVGSNDINIMYWIILDGDTAYTLTIKTQQT